MNIDVVISAIVWTLITTIVAQTISVMIMWAFGLPPRKLIQEIEDVQNPAVGAMFFVISLSAALFMGKFSEGVPSPEAPALETALWVAGGLIMATVLMLVSVWSAHIIMGKNPGENLFTYLRREIMDEQNASLALFIGGLSVAPFIAVAYQVL
jgi:hypothetical protein